MSNRAKSLRKKYADVPLVDVDRVEDGILHWEFSPTTMILTVPGSRSVELMVSGETLSVVSAAKAYTEGKNLYQRTTGDQKRYGNILCTAAYYAAN